MLKRKNKAILCAIASIAVTNSAVVFPTNAMAFEQTANLRAITKMEVYNTSSLNIRNGAGTKYTKIGSASKGQVLEVISISNGWAKINYKNGIGYCSASYLKKVETSTSTPSTKQMIVKVDDLSVRNGAGTNYTKLGSLNKGDKVTVVSELSNGWVKIEFNNGYGYVSNVKGAYLELASSSDTPSTPETSTPEGSTAQYFATADINLRKTASWSGEIITVIKKGVNVEVVSINNNNWAKVNYNGNVGYVPSTHITKVESSTPSQPNQPSEPNTPSQPETPSVDNRREMTVVATTLSVRTGSSTSYTKLGELKKGEKIIALEELTNGWVKIEYKGNVAYVSNVKGAYLEKGHFVKDIEDANKVMNLIKTLDKNITLDDKNDVAEVRKAYEELNSSAKSLVTNLSVLTKAENKIVNFEKANTVIELIESLDSTIELQDKAEVEKAKEAFDALNPEAKALVTNVDKLTQAIAEIERLEKEQTDIETSNEVVSIIGEIEALSGVIELGNKELISRARMAYNNLSPEAKALVPAETLRILEEAETEIKRLEDEESARIVQEKIELLNRDIVITDYEATLSIRAEYENLSQEAKALVTNLSILESAEQTVAEKRIKYNEVMTLIGKLPTTITLDHKVQVEEARNSFDCLDQDIQYYITTTAQEHYQILTRAEETIALLEEAKEEEEKSEEEKAQELLQSIQERLGDLMGRDVTLDDKETIVQIRKDYNSLPSNLKIGMISTLIEEFEMQIEGLEAVKSIQDKIDSLQGRELTLADEDTVAQIRQEYNALRFDLKSKISEEDIKALELEIEGLEYVNGRLDDVRKKEYEQKTANAVIEKINSLQKDILLTDYISILTARREYDKLFPDAKLLVNNLDVLERAEVTIEAKKNRYEKAMDLIGGLPDDIALEHEAQIIEAREAFESLTPDEKEHALQFKEHYQLLTRAEEALERLKNEI